MRERRWLLLALYGLLVAIAVSDALKATRPKFKIATTSTTTTTTTGEPAAAESADDEVEAATTTAQTDTNATTGHTLTGIPQIDYIWDPNLPRELNGYNLSDYPFYASMPEDIDFKCDGLHDGFYASVPHKCQVYHHCLFGTRYDFLCANFTAFDQKTFICHFVSEVDCANSKKYWHRNDALYKAATSTSTTSSTTSTTTTTTAPSADKSERAPARERDLPPPRRRRPPMRRPAYDYYDEDYYDDDYGRVRSRGYNRRDYDDYEDRKYRRDRDRDRDYRHRDFRDRDRFPARANRRDPARARDPIEDEPLRTRLRDQDSSRTRDVEDRVRDGDERRYSDKRFRDDYDEKDTGPLASPGNSEGLVKPAAPPSSVYARPRMPPKLRRPVPLSEQDKYAYSTSTTIRIPIDEPRRRPADDLHESRRRPIVEDSDEPRRRPTIEDVDDSRRRPVTDDLDEPRRRPVEAADELRRRPVIDEADEPRRRPLIDSTDELRRRPVLDEPDEPRRRPIVDSADDLRRRPVIDDIDEPRRRPTSDIVDEPRRRPVVEDLEDSPRRPVTDTTDEHRRRPIVDSLEEPRRRPVDALDDDYYYEDELDDVRPRWQMRGRPLRDRDFSDKRYRDRPFRSRYRDDEDDVRPRKHSERSRDRFYERDRERGPDRGRDRSLDRPKERNVDRDRTPARGHDIDKPDRPSIYNRPIERDRESERPRTSVRSKETQETTEIPKKSHTYDRNTTDKFSITTTIEPEKETLIPQTEVPKDRQQKYSFSTIQSKPDIQQQQQQLQQQQQQQQQLYQQQQQQNQQQQPKQKHSHNQYPNVQETTTEKELPQKYWKPTPQTNHSNQEKDEPVDDYPSEYYDDIEEPAVPLPPPRPTVRVIKRPFLPSRGGNPNPRGLSPVGSKAPTSFRREENPLKHFIKPQTTTVSYANLEDDKDGLQEDYQIKNRPYDNKQNYNSYKNVHQSDLGKKQHQPINDNYDVPVTRPALRRPEPEIPKRRPEIPEVSVPQKTTTGWTTDYGVQEQINEANNPGSEQPSRGNIRHTPNDNSNLYSSSYKNDDVQEQLGVNGNFNVKQKINEVTHHNLQDIPESEYDVTLNEALTPNLSQEPSIPSGFVLPLHRQLGRDAILQPSENTYKFSRPLNQQQHQQQKLQQQQQAQQTQQQNSYVSNSPFSQSTGLARNGDRGKTVYFRTPETIQISGTQYRQQRGHWGDYTGF